MARWSRTLLALAAAVLLAVPSAFAQGGGASSTGSISGEVKDAQGGVLPGVTVTATSPAQIGQLFFDGRLLASKRADARRVPSHRLLQRRAGCRQLGVLAVQVREVVRLRPGRGQPVAHGLPAAFPACRCASEQKWTPCSAMLSLSGKCTPQ